LEKILAPIDGSEKSDESLEMALELAESTGSEVEILHVLEPIYVSTPVYPTSYVRPSKPYPGTYVTPGEPTKTFKTPEGYSGVYTNRKKAGENILDEAAQKVRKKHPEVEISKKLLEGEPDDTIVNEAKKHGFDLIVMGASGLGLKEIVLGNTTTAVARKSETPVLVYK